MDGLRASDSITTGQQMLEGPAEPPGRWHRAAVALMTLVLALFSPAAFVVLGWFTEAYRDTEAASEVSHRLHEVVFGILFSIALAGAVSQWRAPRSNIAGLAQLTTTVLGVAVVVTATVGWDPGLLLYLAPLAAVLVNRPRGGPLRPGRMWWSAVVLTIVALPAFGADIVAHSARAQDAAQNHTTHWSAMAAFGVVLLALGFIVALRLTGHRLTAITLGLASIAYGIAALAFPFDASSHRSGFAIGVILWGALWLVMAGAANRERARGSGAMRLLGTGLALFVALVVGRAWVSLDSPPNVPHRPHPEQPALDAAEVDRATCLDCHANGTGGAPIPPHELFRSCDDAHCWGGRADCAGCHRLDPDLGGPEDLLAAGSRPAGIHLPHARGEPLASPDLAALQGLLSRS